MSYSTVMFEPFDRAQGMFDRPSEASLVGIDGVGFRDGIIESSKCILDGCVRVATPMAGTTFVRGVMSTVVTSIVATIVTGQLCV